MECLRRPEQLLLEVNSVLEAVAGAHVVELFSSQFTECCDLKEQTAINCVIYNSNKFHML